MIAIIGAPSNLGLRPPRPTSVPGCAKAPEALREAGLHQYLSDRGAQDAGVVTAPRYVDDHVPGRLRNQDAIVAYSRRLAARIEAVRGRGMAPLVLGGDCGILVGTGLAMARRGRFGLVHVDGHTDFRHPGNSADCASLAGEDLPAVIGRHWAAVSDIDGLGPYFRPSDVVHLGCRDDDSGLAEARSVLGAVLTASDVRERGPRAAAEQVRAALAGLDGFWLHLDVDVLDPEVMPAVDSPDPGGLEVAELRLLLAGLAPWAVGAQVTVFDPDLDPDGRYARTLAELLADGLGELAHRYLR